MLNVRRAPSHERREIWVPHLPTIVGDASQQRITATVNTDRVDRYGTRILPAGMRIAEGPLALLFNHDSRVPAGRIEQIERAHNSIVIEAVITDPRVWEMVRSGTVTGTSIGFQPLEWDFDDDDAFVCRSWELAEVSICAVPANVDARITEIRSAAGGDRSLSPDYVRDLASQLAEEVFRMPPYPAPQRPDPGPGGPRLVGSVPLSAPSIHSGRAQRYDVGKVLRHLAGDQQLDGMEREIAVELERRAGPAPTRGIRIPSAMFKRAVSTDPGSIQALSPSQYLGGLLDDMSQIRRWAPLLQRCGFVTVNSSRETVIIPKRNRAIVASWGSKDAPAGESDWGADDDTVQPRFVKSWVKINRSALKYGDPSALLLTLNDLGDAIDDEADSGLLFGDGTNDQPTGLLFAPGRVLDLAGASASTSDFMDLKNGLLEQWKKDDPSGVRWVMNGRSWDALRVTSKKQSTGAGEEWPSGIAPFDTGESILFQIAVIQSGKVRVLAAPNNYTVYLVYGAMGCVVWFANGSIDTIIDTATFSTSGGMRVSGFLDCNVVARDPHIMHAMINVLAAPPAGAPLAGASPLPANGRPRPA
jgi:HK97 family phage prohead protease